MDMFLIHEIFIYSTNFEGEYKFCCSAEYYVFFLTKPLMLNIKVIANSLSLMSAIKIHLCAHP